MSKYSEKLCTARILDNLNNIIKESGDKIECAEIEHYDQRVKKIFRCTQTVKRTSEVQNELRLSRKIPKEC